MVDADTLEPPITPLTRRRPARTVLSDLAFAAPILHRMANLEVGAALAVKDREIIAVAAAESTDAVIERAAGLCRSGRWVLIRTGKPDAAGPATVDPGTIDLLARSGAAGLAVENDRVILQDRRRLLDAADRARITVVRIPAFGAAAP